MQTVQRLMINICSNHLNESKTFYSQLFDFNIDYDSDWFIHLISKDKQLEIGIIDVNHDLVPEGYKTSPTGFYVTLVVESADATYELAQAKGYEIVAPPEDTFYGQRRLLLKDPDGTMVDVSSPIPNFQF